MLTSQRQYALTRYSDWRQSKIGYSPKVLRPSSDHIGYPKSFQQPSRLRDAELDAKAVFERGAPGGGEAGAQGDAGPADHQQRRCEPWVWVDEHRVRYGGRQPSDHHDHGHGVDGRQVRFQAGERRDEGVMGQQAPVHARHHRLRCRPRKRVEVPILGTKEWRR